MQQSDDDELLAKDKEHMLHPEFYVSIWFGKAASMNKGLKEFKQKACKGLRFCLSSQFWCLGARKSRT
jgi:hypothetical protein